jgi:DNA-binding transcriptional MerR regulator
LCQAPELVKPLVHRCELKWSRGLCAGLPRKTSAFDDGLRATERGSEKTVSFSFDSNTVTLYYYFVHQLSLSINELADQVNAWCKQHGIEPANGQSGELVSPRNIRFYRTTGLVDAPESGGTIYGEKHLLQLTAVRLLQAQGLPLRRIRELLFGRAIEELREIQRRGLAEAKSLSATRPLMPASDELWRMIPINDDFMIVSRRGATLSAEQRAAILRALQGPSDPTQNNQTP